MGNKVERYIFMSCLSVRRNDIYLTLSHTQAARSMGIERNAFLIMEVSEGLADD